MFSDIGHISVRLGRVLPVALGLCTGLCVLHTSATMAMAQSGNEVVYCTVSNRVGSATSCDQMASMRLRSEAADITYAIRVTAPTTHCSPVSYAIVRPPYTRGTDIIGSTEILQPGQSTYVTVGNNWRPGDHELKISATGLVSGCNVGQMHSWGVTWQVQIQP